MVKSKTNEIYPKGRYKGFEIFNHMHNALPLVTTKYVVKTRVDQKFSNFNHFIDMVVNNDKIIMFPIYVRGAESVRYHPGDMLFGCSTEKMKSIWLNHYNTQVKCKLIEPAVWKGWMDLQANNMGLKQIDEMSQSEYGNFFVQECLLFSTKEN